MGLLKKKLLVVVVGCICSCSAFADNNSTTQVTVLGTIIKDLTLNVDTPVRFGEVAKDPVTAPSVTLTVTDQATGAFTIGYTNNGSPDVSETGTGTESITASAPNRSEVGPGKIAVSGEPNYHYVATTPSPYATITPAGQGVSMNITTFSGFRTLSGTGSDSFYLGGTFTVPTAAALGNYTGTIDVTVTYD